ncbi:MAG: hypothetical protein IPM53_29320 [Anaerolineaceae bacterium]|nr:hypothetical protein [Anaerolineaceae bacterium]
MDNIPTKVGAGLQPEERFNLVLLIVKVPGDNGRYHSFIICDLCGYWLHKVVLFKMMDNSCLLS